MVLRLIASLRSLFTSEVPPPMKFSAIALAAMTADNTVTQAHAALAQAEEADAVAHDALMSALKLRKPPKAAIVDPDTGAISVYSLDAAGTGYVVEVFGGDFEVPAVDPAPDPSPAVPPSDDGGDQAVS